MDADSYLAIVGWLVIISCTAGYVVDNHTSFKFSTRNFSVEGLIRFLGVIGIMILFCLAFTFGSWLISTIYWLVIEFVGELLLKI
jgi:hypothetical protein